MTITKDERAVAFTEDKKAEVEEREAIKQLICTMSGAELRHVRFFIYGLKSVKNS